MFGSTPKKRKFSYTTTKSLKTDTSRPLKERMKLGSYSSQGIKSSKKKMLFYVILLLIVLAFMLNYGFRTINSVNIKVNENELEKVNG